MYFLVYMTFRYNKLKQVSITKLNQKQEEPAYQRYHEFCIEDIEPLS